MRSVFVVGLSLPLWTAGAFAAGERVADERSLVEAVHPDVIVRLALARNPDLAEQRARIAVTEARKAQATRLPDPRLKGELWGVPIRRPLDFNMADTIMIGLNQTFPAFGTRAAQERAASANVAVGQATLDVRRRELRAQVRRAFADYFRADRELTLHREHADLTARVLELARASYRSGGRGQGDVLRLGLELARVHSDVSHIEQERRSAVALLNALMNRAPDAPLGHPADLEPELRDHPAPQVAPDAERSRPELAAARASVERGEAELEAAQKSARWPTLMVGADYWYMPMLADPHGYGAMVSISIPWFNRAHADEVRAAEQTVAAEKQAQSSVQIALRYEISDALAKYEAARTRFAIVDTDVLPQAQRTLEAAQAAYSTGQGDAMSLIDALRSYLDVRIERVRALVHLANTEADLERATAPTPASAQEVSR